MASSWNHRVIKRRLRRAKGSTETIDSFGIHEVYFEDDGVIWGWTKRPMAPYGETLEELENDVKWFVNALKEPVLDEIEMLAEIKKRKKEKRGGRQQ